MKINERIDLLMLSAKDLEEAVRAYVTAQEITPNSRVYAGYGVPLHYSKEAIQWRIVQMRQDLNVLREELLK